MRLNTAEQETIRSRPQQTKIHLGIFQPREVFRCKLNNVNAARGDRVIPFDSVSVGNFSAVEPGMSVYAESSVGARDLGRVRIKSITSTQFVVAENSDIPWADNIDLFVLRHFPIDAIYPRIVPTFPGSEDVIFYKDYDISYTNQNSILGTFVNMGPHRMVFRDCASGIAQSYWSSSGTYNLISVTGSSYSWAFEGGTPTGSTSPDPGYISYNTAGHYVTRLIVSGSNGSVDTSYRYISVYDYPGCGPNIPIVKWELESLSGSRSEGGYNASIVLHQIVDIHEGDVVVLFAEDWYGDTKRSFGGNHPNNSQILFVGYVLNGTINFNYQNSTVRFQLGSVTEYIKQMEGFSISVESKPSPATWYELLDMDIRRGLYHYLRWQSTVLTTTDFQFIGDDQKIQFFDADRTSIYDAVDSLIRSALMGELVSDRQGKIFAEVQAPLTPNATGTYTPVMEITKRDWMNDPRLDEVLIGQTSFIELGGIAYSGIATGTYSALLSNAPGAAPAYRGRVIREQGLALSSQAQLNQLSGNLYAMNNSSHPMIDMDLTGNYRNLDIAPQEAVLIDLSPEDTIKGVRIRSTYFPTSMQWNWNRENQTLYPRTTFKPITSGRPGESIIIPDVPPSSGFSVPRIRTPTVPQITLPSMFGGLFAGAIRLAYLKTQSPLISLNPPSDTESGIWTISKDSTGLMSLSSSTGARTSVSGFYLVSLIASVSSDGAGTGHALVSVSVSGLGGAVLTMDPSRAIGPRLYVPVSTNFGPSSENYTSARFMYIDATSTITLTATTSGSGQIGIGVATVTLTLLQAEQMNIA